jgi:cobalt-zinc-cadmium efflux system outer membrane protein
MKKGTALAIALLAWPLCVFAQQKPAPAIPPAVPPSPPRADTSQIAPTRITLDEAIRLALQHNHALLALRTTILQNQAQEITANLRPNPVLAWDTQFLPIFEPSNFTANYFENQAQFDIGIGYLFERGKKRQHRLQAAKDATAVTRAQVTDSERQLTFNVSQQFVNVLLAQSTVELAQQDHDSFQKTVEISEARFKAGDISEGDLLKIKLQLLQFQSDVLTANLAKVQALTALRQEVGFESVPENFDVEGELDYTPVHAGLDDLKLLALQTRPDLQAAHLGVKAAQSQESLAEANGKRDLNVTFDYTHTGSVNSAAFFFNIDLPIFDRNQGEIARTRYAINQFQEQQNEAAEQVISDVVDAYQALHANDQIIKLYRAGFVDDAQKSRDITEYAYRKGAASLLDFLDSERTYRANQLAYRQALASYMTALEQMRQAVGTRNLP